jgi:hypothetical protein
MPIVKCCKAQLWPSGVFFSNEIHSWDDVRKSAVRVEELRYMQGWHPWNTIYRVVTQKGKEETYAIHENRNNRNCRAWYHKMRENGLCVRCTRPTKSDGCMCAACREKHNETYRAKRRERSLKGR